MSDAPSSPAGADRAASEVEILKRQVELLRGQLYHQIELIQHEKARADHHENRIDDFLPLMKLPEKLSDAMGKIQRLEEELGGRREKELEMRLRVTEVEGELAARERHIQRLEQMLEMFWNNPTRRALRDLKNRLRSLRPGSRGADGGEEGTDAPGPS